MWSRAIMPDTVLHPIRTEISKHFSRLTIYLQKIHVDIPDVFYMPSYEQSS